MVSPCHLRWTLDWEEVVIVLGVGMPERQESNREVVRRWRKKQTRERYPPSPLKKKTWGEGIRLGVASPH